MRPESGETGLGWVEPGVRGDGSYSSPTLVMATRQASAPAPASLHPSAAKPLATCA